MLQAVRVLGFGLSDFDEGIGVIGLRVLGFNVSGFTTRAGNYLPKSFYTGRTQ